MTDKMLLHFFTDDFSDKMNQLNFQLEFLIEKFYPILFFKWSKHNLMDGALFSSFIISLFTNLEDTNTETVKNFWDILIVEKWNGFFKCILYIIDYYYDVLIQKDTNDTLAFINDLKNS